MSNDNNQPPVPIDPAPPEVEAEPIGTALEVQDSPPAEPPPPEAAPDLMFEAPRAASRHGFGRPPGLESPRDGAKDNLKRISGITPVLESSLNGLGIYHFDQIAAWDQKEVTWVEAHLSLRGRIGKEKWLEQARDLSAGRACPARPVRR